MPLLLSAGPPRPPAHRLICIHPVPAVPTWMSFSIVASHFLTPNSSDFYLDSALASHSQPGPGPSIPTSPSSSDHRLPSFQLPHPHTLRLLRDFFLQAHRPPACTPSPSWAHPVSSILSLHCLLAGEAPVLSQEHSPPSPPCSTVTRPAEGSHATVYTEATLNTRAPTTEECHFHPEFLSQLQKTSTLAAH